MTLQDLKNKRIAIFGKGEEGKAVMSYLKKHKLKAIFFESTSKRIAELSTYDVIFRSPGANPDLPVFKQAKKHGATITSQTQYFFDNCKAVVYGVTGTKGKSTTSNALYVILKAGLPHKKVFLTGNIGGNPPLELLDTLTAGDLVVFELSSFQLADVTISPKFALVVRIEDEHLDYHGTRTKYISAKQNLVINQKPTDYCIYLASSKGASLIASRSKAKKVAVNPTKLLPNLKLLGQHNQQNVALAIEAARLSGVKKDAIAKSLKFISPLKHRLELVHEKNNIRFIDDSLATNVPASIAAIETFSNNQLIVIVGGSGKTKNFNLLLKALRSKHIKAVICMGLSGTLLYNKLKNKKNTFKLFTIGTNFKTAFSVIGEIATSGDIVLLAPADASFDMFKNYKERGELFSKYARTYFK